MPPDALGFPGAFFSDLGSKTCIDAPMPLQGFEFALNQINQFFAYLPSTDDHNPSLLSEPEKWVELEFLRYRHSM